MLPAAHEEYACKQGTAVVKEKSKRPCLCCGEDVETTLVDRHGTMEVVCIYCGFVIDQYLEKQSGERETKEKKPDPALVIMVADDSEATRKLVEVTLGEADFVSEVSTFENGNTFCQGCRRSDPRR